MIAGNNRIMPGQIYMVNPTSFWKPRHVFLVVFSTTVIHGVLFSNGEYHDDIYGNWIIANCSELCSVNISVAS